MSPNRPMRRAAEHTGEVQMTETTETIGEPMGEARKAFHEELDDLRREIVREAAMVTETIPRGTEALLGNDLQAAQAVIDGDDELDYLSLEIEEHTIRVLTLQQPVASDLRFITMSLKFVVDLERIGDLAAGIAKRVRELAALPTLGPYVDLGRLATLAQKNLHAALDSFVRRDADAATKVIAADVEIDKLNASLFAELIAHVATDPATVTRVIPLTSICRYLERVGDHVKNLAEEVVYMVRATIASRPRGRLNSPAAVPRGPRGTIHPTVPRPMPRPRVTRPCIVQFSFRPARCAPPASLSLPRWS